MFPGNIRISEEFGWLRSWNSSFKSSFYTGKQLNHAVTEVYKLSLHPAFGFG